MKNQDLDNEQRMSELETQLAFQEDHIQKLNEALIDQQNRIQVLEVAVKHYEKRLNEIQEGVGAAGESSIEDEVPPHY